MPVIWMWCKSPWPDRKRRALLATGLAAAAGAPGTIRSAGATESADAILAHELLPGSALVGAGALRAWGMLIYHATLWARPGWRAQQLGREPVVLVLHYARALRGADIAERSVLEMRRAGPLPPETEARWLSTMQRLFPDVAAGDRLGGRWDPGHGAQFAALRVGSTPQPLGAVDDPLFAARFFGIWLAPSTSAPALRAALLGQADPALTR
ncbi:MAG: hypothetical protein RMK34_03945 [Tepidimonas sp.]|uniref:hypothetical protein n=1 Tax=Tepidimonas sp. TaxID=2002775 RepID=UPI00298ED8D6|nr:hypothetical protein [Tepidimonas sp.]MCS6810015.1 chalcone isomerase family protein [Tepidimonas sp.]MCX7742442.1 chalcone isomerase family protein [Tepidimonas sp.]MDW8336105.1 hypothetical protein [Tepidimonas sp.]